MCSLNCSVVSPCPSVTSDGGLEVNVELPGLRVDCSGDGGHRWGECHSKQPVSSEIYLRTK